MRISDWSSDVCSSDLWPGLQWRSGPARTPRLEHHERTGAQLARPTGNSLPNAPGHPYPGAFPTGIPGPTQRRSRNMNAPLRHTLLLVDDHPMMRRGIRQMLELEDDLHIVGEASHGEEALTLIEQIGRAHV